MQPVCVIDVVGLTPSCVGTDTPRISAIAREGFSAPMRGVFPAVTCPAQATILTGQPPTVHGIVANGWFSRDLGEVHFWKQSNALIQAPKIYETARRRDKAFTCAKLFWWFNQGAHVDWSVTPKPHYGSDGSKAFGIHSDPPRLAGELQDAFGPFPFPAFWGPKAGLAASDWIARAAAFVLERLRPSLTLVYLPHLDYDLQRFGPSGPEAAAALREVDALVGFVADAARRQGAMVVILSEYGIGPVARPVHINRALREAGWLAVRPGPFGETLETFQSKAFAVSDHQAAHVYVSDPDLVGAVRARLESLPGVDRVLGHEELDHPRAGELIAVAQPDSWFTYYYWLDDRLAPDYARTVDIHRKPGYDPCELFLACPGQAVLGLVKKKFGPNWS